MTDREGWAYSVLSSLPMIRVELPMGLMELVSHLTNARYGRLLILGVQQ